MLPSVIWERFLSSIARGSMFRSYKVIADFPDISESYMMYFISSCRQSYYRSFVMNAMYHGTVCDSLCGIALGRADSKQFHTTMKTRGLKLRIKPAPINILLLLRRTHRCICIETVRTRVASAWVAIVDLAADLLTKFVFKMVLG